MNQLAINGVMSRITAVKKIGALRGYKSALIIALLMGSALIAAAVRAYNPAALRSTGPEPPIELFSAGQSPSDGDRLEVEVVTIRATGFEPSRIKRPAGRFLLAVDNRCGLEEVRLRLDREFGVSIHQANVRWDKLDWRQMLSLQPGTYLLTEENHPTWACRITVGIP